MEPPPATIEKCHLTRLGVVLTLPLVAFVGRSLVPAATNTGHAFGVRQQALEQGMRQD